MNIGIAVNKKRIEVVVTCLLGGIVARGVSSGEIMKCGLFLSSSSL